MNIDCDVESYFMPRLTGWGYTWPIIIMPHLVLKTSRCSCNNNNKVSAYFSCFFIAMFSALNKRWLLGFLCFTSTFLIFIRYVLCCVFSISTQKICTYYDVVMCHIATMLFQFESEQDTICNSTKYPQLNYLK